MSTYPRPPAPIERALLSALEWECGVAPRRSVTGASASTFAIGGPFECLLEPDDEAQLSGMVRLLAAAGVSARVLGAGSNSLLASEGVAGPVVRLGRGFRTVETLAPGRVRAGASYGLMALSREVSEAGLSGLEFAGGIPGSIGGAVVMNAGAHGSDMASVVEAVTVTLPSGEAVSIPAAALSFGYRSSSVPAGAVVTGAILRLAPSDANRTRQARARFLDERRRRQPLQLPSAGSVFRNPEQGAAGALLEAAGLKGRRIGGAEVSRLHANWIVNPERAATDGDVKELIALCQREMSRRGVALVPEIVIWE